MQADCAEAGKKTVASAKSPRNTAQNVEQTYYAFNGKIKQDVILGCTANNFLS